MPRVCAEGLHPVCRYKVLSSDGISCCTCNTYSIMDALMASISGASMGGSMHTCVPSAGWRCLHRKCCMSSNTRRDPMKSQFSAWNSANMRMAPPLWRMSSRQARRASAVAISAITADASPPPAARSCNSADESMLAVAITTRGWGTSGSARTVRCSAAGCSFLLLLVAAAGEGGDERRGRGELMDQTE